MDAKNLNTIPANQTQQYIKQIIHHGAWVAQLVKHLILGFGSGHDLRVMRSSPMLGSALTMESALDSFPLPFPLPPLCSSPCSLSLSK